MEYVARHAKSIKISVIVALVLSILVEIIFPSQNPSSLSVIPDLQHTIVPASATITTILHNPSTPPNLSPTNTNNYPAKFTVVITGTHCYSSNSCPIGLACQNSRCVPPQGMCQTVNINLWDCATSTVMTTETETTVYETPTTQGHQTQTTTPSYQTQTYQAPPYQAGSVPPTYGTPITTTRRSTGRRNTKHDSGDFEDGTQPDLYAEFNVSKTASQDEIKKAYKKLALRYHPDKLTHLSTDEEKQQAIAKFQQIATWYAVLSDPIKRKRYDTTGEIDSEGASMISAKGDAAWDGYFRTLWEEVMIKAIEEMSKKYRGTEEERADVLKAYAQHKGDLWKILDTVMLSQLDDHPRFVTMIQKAIACGEVKEFPLFKKTSEDKKELAKRKKAAEKEAKEAMKEMNSGKNEEKRGGCGLGDDLGALIMERMARPKRRIGGLIARLEETFGGKKAGAEKVETTTKSTEGTTVDPNISTFWSTVNTVKK
ncbi:hypothetical protein HDV00_005502 [Rhizophlyctis rosea]|nr:hypothetical protein HDV00_005502 [Rhizophlyctis rosea]